MAITDVVESPRFHEITMGGGPHGKAVEVFLDGMPLKGVTSITIHADISDVVRVSLEMIASINSKFGAKVEAEIPPLEELPPHMKQIAIDLKKLMEGN